MALALGDVNGRCLLPHMGKYQARVVADAIQGGKMGARRYDGSAHRVVFTDPQMAAVGLTAQQAEQQASTSCRSPIPRG